MAETTKTLLLGVISNMRTLQRVFFVAVDQWGERQQKGQTLTNTVALASAGSAWEQTTNAAEALKDHVKGLFESPADKDIEIINDAKIIWQALREVRVALLAKAPKDVVLYGVHIKTNTEITAQFASDQFKALVKAINLSLRDITTYLQHSAVLTTEEAGAIESARNELVGA